MLNHREVVGCDWTDGAGGDVWWWEGVETDKALVMMP